MNFLNITFILSILCLVSCAKTEEQLVRAAIQEAKYHLTSMDCDAAMGVLDDVDFQSDNADYISVYASSQACYAGYKELDFLFGGNLENINSSSLIGSLATFSSSNETSAGSTAFTSIQNAITTLLSYDGGTQPSTVDRTDKFGIKESGDLSLQALYLIFVNMGKFFAYYGNVDSSGVKGNGALGNSCIFSYTTNDAVDWINGTSPGNCSAATGSEGSDDLEAPVTSAVIKTRLCQGIVLYNNMMDILSNLTLPGSDSLGDVANIQSALNTLMNTAEGVETGPYNDGPVNGQNAIATMRAITGQAACEAENIERIEKFYAIFFETIF